MKQRASCGPICLNDAPIAVTSDGTVLANARHLHPSHDLEAIVAAAVERGGEIFVGTALRGRETKRVRAHLEDAAAEAVATLLDPPPRPTRSRRHS